MARALRLAGAAHSGGRLIVLLVLPVVLIATVAAPAAVSRFSGMAQIWEGYYLLAADRSALDGDRLDRAFAGSLTAAAPVRFTVFDGFEEQPVDRLTLRLDPIDPRFDPFLQSVAGYFTATEPSGGERSLRYLPSRLPPAGLLLRLAIAWPAAALDVLDFDVRMRICAAGAGVAVALVAAVAGLAVGRSASGIRVAASIVPWIVAVLNAGGAALIAAAGVIPAMASARGATPPRAAGAIAAIAVLMTAASALIGGALVGLAVGAATIGSIAAAALPGGGHRRRSAAARRPRAASALLAGSLVALITVAATVGSSLPDVAVPAPDDGTTPLTLDGLARLGLRDSDDRDLPTAADYVTHVAFQEGLPYGRRYRLPAEGERLTLSTFRFDPDAHRMQRTERLIVTYDQRWLRRVIADARGVGRLLLDRGTAVAVHRQRLADLARSRWDLRSAVMLAVVSAGVAMGAALMFQPARRRADG